MADVTSSARDAATHIVRVLTESGHVSYFAGGCVRDQLLGLTPSDYDVATSAEPTVIRTLFRRTRAVGQHFGVVLVQLGAHTIEVATFRTDGEYKDGRRPEQVTFSTPQEDARRRDFTINGLFFDPLTSRVIDFVNGQADLQSGLLRAIGNPAARFREDHLRLLRAVRFAARFGLVIEPDTWTAIRALSGNLTGVSAERVLDELTKMAGLKRRVPSGQSQTGELGRVSPVARCLQLIVDAGLLPAVMPEYAPFCSQLPTAVALLDQLTARLPTGLSLATFMAAWLGSASPGADQRKLPELGAKAARRLRGSNELVDHVRWLLTGQAKLRTALEPADYRPLRAHPCWPELAHIAEARLALTNDPADLVRQNIANAERFDSPAAAMPPPLVNGDILTAHGVAPSRALGEALKLAYRAQLNGELTTPEAALTFALARCNAADA